MLERGSFVPRNFMLLGSFSVTTYKETYVTLKCPRCNVSYKRENNEVRGRVREVKE